MDYWPEFDSKLDFQYNCLLSQTTSARNHQIYNQSQMTSVRHTNPGNSHDAENSKRSQMSIAWIVIIEVLVRLVLGK